MFFTLTERPRPKVDAEGGTVPGNLLLCTGTFGRGTTTSTWQFQLLCNSGNLNLQEGERLLFYFSLHTLSIIGLPGSN